jgi:hypothetical protein
VLGESLPNCAAGFRTHCVANSINRGAVTHGDGDNLYNWQFYIQESKAKEERKEEEIERCTRSIIQVDTDQYRPVGPVSHSKVQAQSVTVLRGRRPGRNTRDIDLTLTHPGPARLARTFQFLCGLTFLGTLVLLWLAKI